MVDSLVLFLSLIGEALGAAARTHAQALFGACAGLALGWLTLHAAAPAPLPRRSLWLPLAMLCGLAGVFYHLNSTGVGWRPYKFTTEYFFLPAFVMALFGAFARAGSAGTLTGEGPAAEDANLSPTRLCPRDMLWLFVLLLAGAVVRCYRLGDLPSGFHNEYAETAAAAITAIETREPHIIAAFHAPDWKYLLFLRTHALYLTDLWTAIFALFGVSMTTYNAGIIFCGLLYVAAFYIWARLEFPPGEARLAAVLAAFSFHAMAISRNGWAIHIFAVFQFVLVLIFSGLALRTRRWGWYLATAAVLAVSLYNHRVTYCFQIILAGRVAFAWRAEEVEFWRRHGLRFAAAFALFLLLMAPFIHYTIKYRHFALITTQAVWGGEPSIPGDNAFIKAALKIQFMFGEQGYFMRSSVGWRHSLVQSQGSWDGWLSHPAESVMALIGLAVCLRRIRRESYFLLVLMLAVTPLPAILSHPVSRRLCLIIVPITMLAGIGALAVLRAIQAALPERRRAVPAVLGAIGLALVIAGSVAGFRATMHVRSYIIIRPFAEWTSRLIDSHYVYVVINEAGALEHLRFTTWEQTGPDYKSSWTLVPWHQIDEQTTFQLAEGKPPLFLMQLPPVNKQHKNKPIEYWRATARQFPSLQVRQLKLYAEPEPAFVTRLLCITLAPEDMPNMPGLIKQFYIEAKEWNPPLTP